MVTSNNHEFGGLDHADEERLLDRFRVDDPHQRSVGAASFWRALTRQQGASRGALLGTPLSAA